MRPTSLLHAAAVATALFSSCLRAADPADMPAANSAPPATTVTEPAEPEAEAKAAPATTTPSASETPPSAAAEPSAPGTTSDAPSKPETQPAAEPTVITAQIDPALAVRLSMLEKAMQAQSESQSAIYGETSRLLMFFGSACVGMGLLAMIAAVFLMHRTLASVSAITVQVAQAQHAPALPAATAAALVPAAAGGQPTGFEKVQASGQRFQSRMTSLEQRLEELEHLAGHAGSTAPVHGGTDSAPAAPQPDEAVHEPAPRRVIPLSAILVRKAETQMNLGKLNEAMTTLDEAATHEGDPAEIHLARGRVLEKLGRLGDALQSYDLAVTKDETNTAALLMKAGVLNRQERFDEALSCYERALAVHKANA